MAWKMGIPLKSPKLVAHAVVCEELAAGRRAARAVREGRDPKAFLSLAKRCGSWFDGAEERLAQHIAPCSQLERFLCAFDADALEYDKSEGSADVDRAPPARRRASAMMGHLLDRLADLLQAVESAPEDTELEDEVAKRSDVDNLVVAMANLLTAKHQETIDLLHGHARELAIVRADSEYLFLNLADDELKSDWKKLKEKFGPRLFPVAAHAAIKAG